MKVRNSVHRSEDEVSIIDEDTAASDHNMEAGIASNYEGVFNEATTHNTTETSVSIDVPTRSHRGRKGRRGSGGSLHVLSSTNSVTESIGNYPYSLPHSYFTS